ncbi:hypothetical protein [Okeania sp.]|uniref:hypothetical protein n=1 Tax=Okeania sp. TaxID=3100323 RepID=UPI002B4AE3F4|nr:hypothetical protein [Okeania sp.]MEB3340273.1 hypothetical protein [Okeania sp.]
MSQTSKFDQFIYGKFVGKESGYRIVSYSENLNNNLSDLADIAETNYSFWGSQSGEQNPQAVGICRNNTQVLSSKKIILIQTAPAFNKDKNFFLRSGSRSFFQHRYVFVSEAEMAAFNNRIFWLLRTLSDLTIPSFSDVNLPYDSEKNSWLLGKESFLNLLPAEEGTDEKVKNTIRETWKRLPENGKDILLQALSVILNGKRLLLTAEQKAKNLALKLLDNILLFLPTNMRNQISLAIGSVEPKYCKWAQIIVNLDGSGIGSLPENMVWLDFNKYEFDKEEFLNHEYVQYFIAPNKDKYEDLITICEYLDKNTKDNSDDLVWEFEEVDGWLKLNNPSLDFIFKYLPEKPDKIETLGKYISRMEDKVQNFLVHKFWENSSAQNRNNLKLLELLWKALPISGNNGSLILSLLFTIYRFLPDKFLEIVKADHKFFDSLEILIANKFIDWFTDKNIRDDILQELQNDCFQLIEKRSKNYSDYQELEELIIGCEKIFRSEKEKFHLWDLALVRITRDNFKHLFIERLFPLLDKETFAQSHLKKSWQKNFPDTLDYLTFYLLEKDKGIFHIPEIANDLKLTNSEANKLYLICLQSHLVTYQKTLPLLESAIQKSVTFSEQRVQFQTNYFMAVYEWFNSQYFQDNSPEKSLDKVDLISILSKLIRASNSNRWINWQNLSNFLCNNDIDRTNFLDKTVGKGFPVEMLETWLQLLDTYPENKEIEAEFIASKAWELLNRKTLRKMREHLTSTYHKYVPKFIYWANKHEKLDLSNDTPIELISGELIEYITEIWHQQKSIDEKLWNLLTSEVILSKLSNKDCLELINIHWRLSADSLSLTLTNLSERAKNFFEEEKKYLIECAKEIISQFKDLQSLKNFLKKCWLFYDYSKLLEIMRYAEHNVKSEISYNEVMP